MALFKNILDSLKLTDDEDDELEDDYDEYVIKQQEKENRRQEQKLQRQEQKFVPRKTSVDDDVYSAPDYSPTPMADAKRERPARTNVNKVVPLRKNVNGFEVCIMKPSSFEDSQEICDVLLNGRAAVINLEGYDVEIAQRIMDFISGAVYAVNGKLHQISNYIFIISPDNIDISGDNLDMIEQNGFEIPTFTKNF